MNSLLLDENSSKIQDINLFTVKILIWRNIGFAFKVSIHVTMLYRFLAWMK